MILPIPEVWPYPWQPRIVTTGTRQGMNMRQWLAMNWYLHMLTPELVRHGDCLGSDAQVHDIVEACLPTCETHVHPCDLSQFRAYRMGNYVYPSARPIPRNHHMVDHTDVTIATPFEDEPVLRSGTWSTIRYSMSSQHPTILLSRSGRVSVYDGRKVLQMKTAILTLGTIDADGVTAGVAIDESHEGFLGVYVSSTGGTFGTLKLQASPSDTGTTDYVDVPNASWTAAGYKHLQVFGRRLRLSLSGSTTPGITAKTAGVLTGPTVTNS